jgi:hypothetical protein
VKPFVFLLVLLSAGDAAAYCRARTVDESNGGGPECKSSIAGCADPGSCGVPVYFPNRCIGWTVHDRASRQLSYDAAVGLIERAFRRWTDAKCEGGAHPSVEARYLGPTACGERFRHDRPSASSFVFKDDAWPGARVSPTGIAAIADDLAVTRRQQDTDDGEIVGATIEVNTNQYRFAIGEEVPIDAYDLEYVMTHEIGHFLGIAHSDTDDSVMRERTGPGKQDPTLRPDDVAAICALYPPDGARDTAQGTRSSATCNPMPRNGFAAACEEAPPGARSCAMGTAEAPPSLAAIVAVAAVLFRRLTRRARARCHSWDGEKRLVRRG